MEPATSPHQPKAPQAPQEQATAVQEKTPANPETTFFCNLTFLMMVVQFSQRVAPLKSAKLLAELAHRLEVLCTQYPELAQMGTYTARREISNKWANSKKKQPKLITPIKGANNRAFVQPGSAFSPISMFVMLKVLKAGLLTLKQYAELHPEIDAAALKEQYAWVQNHYEAIMSEAAQADTPAQPAPLVQAAPMPSAPAPLLAYQMPSAQAPLVYQSGPMPSAPTPLVPAFTSGGQFIGWLPHPGLYLGYGHQ